MSLRASIFLGLFAVVFGFAIAGSVSGQAAQQRIQAGGPVPDQFVVVFDEEVNEARGLALALSRRHAFNLRHVYDTVLKGFSARMPLAVAQLLAQDPSVAYVERDLVARAVETLPSGVSRIEAHLNPQAASVNVKVAVLDTGVDLDHQDLNVVQGVDCTGGSGCSSSPTAGNDGNGHGTHVAGIIGAIDNEIDVVGVAPGTPIVPVKVLGDDGSGTFDDVIAGINWVTAQGDIPVINMSLSGIGFMQSLRDAIFNSVVGGVVHVVAAGNDNRDIYGTNGIVDTEPVSEPFVCLLFGRNCKGDNIPAAYPEVLTVSASNPGNDDFAGFSNYSADVDPDNPVVSLGAAIDVNAPGVGILSLAAGGGTTTKSGTSMAAPHVAGAAALYIETYGRDLDADGDFDQDDVSILRQELIDIAEANGWFPSGDPDSNPEAIVFAGDFGDLTPPGNDPPVANFGYIATNLVVDFTDTSTDDGAIVSWDWDFGDGHSSTAQNPSHAYAAGGTYAVTLTVTDNDGATDAVTNNVPVSEAENVPPTAGFSSSAADLSVNFMDTSTDSDGTIVSWSWDFGDATDSALQNPSHTYDSAGTYTVTLTVTDDDGATDIIFQDVTVSEPSAITLSATGYKVKGRHHVDLTWSGAVSSEIDVYRDRGLVATTGNTGSYTDSTNNRGGATYIYQVCELGTSTCSTEASVVF